MNATSIPRRSLAIALAILLAASSQPLLAQSPPESAARRAAKEWIERVGGTIEDNPATGELAVSLVLNRELMEVTPIVALPEITELTLASEIKIELNTLVGLPNLRSLHLRMPSCDLTPLAGLANLESLNLQVLRNYDIDLNGNARPAPLELAPLGELSQLQKLQIHSDFHPVSLAGLERLQRLEILELTGAPVHSLEGMAGMIGLKQATLRLDYDANDLTPLAGLMRLEKLNLDILRNHSLEFEDRPEPQFDFAPLGELKNLRELKLNAGGRDIDLQGVDPLPQLARLDLSGTCLVSIENLAGMTGLTHVNLWVGHEVTHLEALAGMTQMQDLWICGHSVTDASALANMQNLQRVFIQLSRQYTDLSCFADMPNLRDLDITACYGVSDLSPIAELPQLERLSLMLCTSVKDLSPLAAMRQLKTLDLRASEITNLEPVAELQQNGLEVIQ